jgi:polyisoprenoid-binding protein YceI
MSHRFLTLALLAVPLAAAAAPDTYTLDPFHTFPNFAVEHLGIATIYGRFDRTSGKFTIDRAARTGAVDLAVETVSLTTGDADKGTRVRSRDDHLRSAEFFNVTEHPRMTYKSAQVGFSGDNPTTVEGELTLIGVTRPLTLTIDKFNCNQAAAPARQRCGGNASGKFKRSDFGMKTGLPAVGDEITLTITFEGLKDLN